MGECELNPLTPVMHACIYPNIWVTNNTLVWAVVCLGDGGKVHRHVPLKDWICGETRWVLMGHRRREMDINWKIKGPGGGGVSGWLVVWMIQVTFHIEPSLPLRSMLVSKKTH